MSKSPVEPQDEMTEPRADVVPSPPEAPAESPRPAAASEASAPERPEQDPRILSNERAVLRRLWQIYSEAVLPLEQKYFFSHFHAPPITVEEFEAKPQVLLLGQYSTGKTSMVKWLTGMDSPHYDVRPQPSTDKFMAVVHGEQERLIHGNAATCLPQLPYQGLSVFGASFLGSFRALVMPADILREITFIDTPGVLSGSKQRIGRDYDFASICAWVAERADLVLLTFDAHKLDISDEFQEVMEVLRPYADKVRCVLNKADQIDATNLVRVYGALLWNVGKVLRTPEVARVYISSFWDEPYRFQDHRQLFDEDKDAVLKELHQLPRTALLRKINALVARVRRVRAHICVMDHIRSQLPWLKRMLGANASMHRWVKDHLLELVEEARRARTISAGDLQNFESFQERMASFQVEHLAQMPPLTDRELARLDRVVSSEIPALIARVGGVTDLELSCRLPSPSPERGSALRRRLGCGCGRPAKRQRTGQ